MKAYVVKPVPVHVQCNLAQYLGHNNYRFVFYTYGTNDYSPPHYSLYIGDSVNLLAELYISEYILSVIN
jgi:hypothetical protein